MPAKMLLFDVAIFIAVIICGNYCVYAGDLNITASTFSNLKAGDIGTITLDFEASSALPHDGKLILILPAGFDAASATGTIITGMDGSIATTNNGQTITVSRNGDGTSLQPSTAVSIRLNNIRNPSISGTTSRVR